MNLAGWQEAHEAAKKENAEAFDETLRLLMDARGRKRWRDEGRLRTEIGELEAWARNNQDLSDWVRNLEESDPLEYFALRGEHGWPFAW
jgi:hypothetical protein